MRKFLVVSLLASALLLVGFGGGGSAVGVVAASTGSNQATPARASGACELARQRSDRARRKLRRAAHALEKAEGAAAKRKARKRVKKAKRAFLAAHEDKVFACSNNPPSFPAQNVYATFDNSYDGLGCLTAVTAKISIRPGAYDQDGDSLTYRWSASNGSIHGSGLHATWKRVVITGTTCNSVPGTVTVTASDGRGGTGSFHYEF